MASRRGAHGRRRLLLLLSLCATAAGADSFFGNMFGAGGPGPAAGADTEYYETLGVGKDATEAQLKRAYRKLALKHHPDKGGSPEKFKQVSEAFSTLSDPRKREVYDRFGKAGVQRTEAGGSPGAGGGMSGGMGVASAEDIFNMFFGGGGGARAAEEAEDTELPLDLSLEEMYTGKSAQVRVGRTRVCARCAGKGTKTGAEAATCTTCEGRGAVLRLRQLGAGMVQQLRVRCPDCEGEGTVVKPSDRCGGCQGRKVVAETAALQVPVPAGISQGEQVVLRGEGSEAPGLRAGDVVLVVREKPHGTYRRQGPNLIAELPLSLSEALFGFERPLRRLDGSALRVRVRRGRPTAPGSVKRVRGEGMPMRGAKVHGDLYVRLRVDLPSAASLSEEKQRALEALLAEVEGGAAAEEGARGEASAERPGGRADGAGAGNGAGPCRELEDV